MIENYSGKMNINNTRWNTIGGVEQTHFTIQNVKFFCQELSLFCSFAQNQ